MQNINTNRCRICLSSQHLSNLYSDELTEKISYCAAVKVSLKDKLLTKICEKCVFYLNIAYVFKTVSEWANAKLLLEIGQANLNNIINNTEQLQCTKYSYVESILKNTSPQDDNLIELVLKKDFLESYKFISLSNNRLQSQQDQVLLDSHIYAEEIITEKDSDEGKESTYQEDDFKPLEESCEHQTVVANLIKHNTYNEKITIMKGDNLITNTQESRFECNEISSGFCKDDLCLIKDNSLVVDQNIYSSQDEEVEKYNAINTKKDCQIVLNKIKIHKCLHNLNEDEAFMLTEEPKEYEELNSVVMPSTDNNTEQNITQEQDALGEENVLVDEDLIYGCETDPDLYDEKAMYGKVCLNTRDPLLHNVAGHATFENEETVLRNIETNFKNCFCVESKPENSAKQKNEKQIILSNISLHDFESFEQEQLSNALSNSIMNQHNDLDYERNKKVHNKALLKRHTENRVGRHIAKKNASQPPKRYSPTPETSKCSSLSHKQDLARDCSSISPEDIKLNEEEQDKIDDKTIKDTTSILSQDYILESDLSMPEPIFEETIVTNGYYFENTDEQPLENNGHDEDVNRKNKKRRLKKRKSSNGSTRRKKKVNIFVDQTARKMVHRKRNKVRNKKQSIKLPLQNAFKSVKITNGDDYNSEDNIKTNNYYSSSDGDTDTENFENHYSTEQRLLNTKSKKQGENYCKLCNKSFAFPSHLQRHLAAHIGVKHFVCKHCNKKFLHRYNLSVHVRSHTGNFPLQCNICKRGFVSSSVLERHKRSHTGETPYECRYCLQHFSHASSLNMHEKMHLNRPSYPCDICYKVFSYKSSLNAHKKGHSGNKPHSCSVCYKKFTRKTSVIRHMSCHSEMKKCKC